MFLVGWGVDGRSGCGGGSWADGSRRRSWGSVSLYYLSFLCRIGPRIGGSSSLTLTEVTLSGEHTNSWLPRFQLLWMTQIDSFGTLRFRWRLPTKNQPDHSRHLISCNSSLCFWLWRGGVSLSFISLMWDFWFSLSISAVVDWHPGGRVHLSTWSLCPVYIFNKWF
jgi:hypothetical protein